MWGNVSLCSLLPPCESPSDSEEEIPFTNEHTRSSADLLMKSRATSPFIVRSCQKHTMAPLYCQHYLQFNPYLLWERPLQAIAIRFILAIRPFFVTDVNEKPSL